MGLGTVDIILLVMSLLASAIIGVYYSVMGRKSTPLEYLLGGRTMTPLPLAMSMMVGTISAITIMGNAGEMYAFGTQLWVMDVGILAGLVVIAKLFIPVLYPLQMVSLYQYVERRFHSRLLRQATVVLQLVGGYMFIGFLLYPPSVALQSLMGLNMFANIIIIGTSCTLYSTFGGVKAVVYADTLQSVVMLVGVLAIVIQGSVVHGGLDKVLDIAYHHGRLEIFNMDLDPYQRYSFWLCIILGFFFALSTNGVNQSQTQRYFSTSSIRDAQWVLYYNAVALLVLRALINLSGLVMFACFKDCDPMGDSDPAVIPIHYVLRELSKIHGLAGLFVAAVYAAVLSSVSTQLNSMTALVWEDFLKVLPVFARWTEVRIGYLQKVIVFSSGVFGVVLGVAISQLGRSFLQTVLSINGALSGPLIGLFLVALFLPWIPSMGATIGFVVAIAFNVMMAAGQLFMPKAVPLPLSRDGCPVDPNATSLVTNVTSTTTVLTTGVPQPQAPPGEWLFGLSDCLNPLWGTCVCILGSILVASITGFNTPDDVDQKLINPTMWRVFKRSIKLYIKDLFSCNSAEEDANAQDEESGVVDPLNNVKEIKESELEEKV